MSSAPDLSATPESNLSYVGTISPVTAVVKQATKQLDLGCAVSDFKSVSSNSGTSAMNASFQIPVGKNNLLGSSLSVRLPLRFHLPILKDNANNVALADAQLVAARNKANYAWAWMAGWRCMKTVSVTINGHTISRDTRELINALGSGISASQYESPAMTSVFPLRDSVAAAGNLVVGTSPFGDPDNSYGASTLPRHSATETAIIVGAKGQVVEVANLNANQTYYVQYDTDFDVPIPLDLFSPDGVGTGIAHLQQVTVDIQFISNWGHLYRLAAALQDQANYTFGQITMDMFRSAPRLSYQIIQPKQQQLAVLNTPQHYTSNFYRQRPETRVAAGANAEIDFESNGIMLESIPKLILITAFRDRQYDATMHPVDPEVFAPISDLTLSLGGSNVLTSLTTFDLFKMSVRNGGFAGSWQEWSRTGGSVCISLSDCDVGVLNNFVGQTTQTSLQVKCKYTPRVAGTYRIYITEIYEETFTISNDGGNVSRQVAVNLTDAEVDAVFTDAAVRLSDSSRRIGAGFGSFIKNIGSKLIDNIPKVVSGIKDIAGLVKMVRGGAYAPSQNVTAGAMPVRPRKAGGIDTTARQQIL